MDVQTLRGNLDRIRDRIEAAKHRSGRNDEVGIVAVTKSHPSSVVEQAIEVGLTRIGENRVQELAAKVDAVGRDRAEWHLIGHLQRNKVRKALPLFDLIHSIDSLRLARELSAEAERAGRIVSGLIQVNVSGEESKYGFSPDEAVDAVAAIVALPGLRIRGLMTMAPFTDDEATIRRTFAGTRELLRRCAEQVSGFEPEHLSMGMSNDFEIAVEEGSTLVRLGTILFGGRT